MKLIAKRGLFEGPNYETENSLDQIKLALCRGFDVEVDVRFIDGKYWLGHDKPQYETTLEFLTNKKIWVHAKDTITYDAIRSHKFHPKVFVHDEEDYAVVTETMGFWQGFWRWQHGRHGKFVYEPTPNGLIKYGMYRDNFKLENVFIDVDGVMCKTKTYDKDHNCISKQFCDLDFTAIKRLQALAKNVIIISGDKWNEGMAHSRNLSFMKTETLGPDSKLNTIKSFNYFNLEESAYIGDDWYDLELLNAVGFGFCPSDSCPDVLKQAEVLPRKAGEGVIAELYENLINKGIVNRVNPIRG